MADQIDATPRLSAPAEPARAQAAASAAIPRPQEPARRSRVTHVPGLRRDRVASGVLVAWAALTTSLAVASLAVALVRPSENGVVSFDAWSWTPGPLVVASRPDGLETDDRVVAVDGVAIDRPLDVREGTHSYTVLRAGAERVVPVSVVSQPLLARIGGGWPVLLFAVGLAGLS